MAKFEAIYSPITFTMVASAESMLIICLLVLVDQLWYLGVFLISLVIFQIFLICLAGTLFQTVCTAYEERVYSIRWYSLSNEQQKIVRSMLQMAQSPKLVTLLGFLPANLDTFKRVSVMSMKCYPSTYCDPIAGNEVHLFFPDAAKREHRSQGAGTISFAS